MEPQFPSHLLLFDFGFGSASRPKQTSWFPATTITCLYSRLLSQAICAANSPAVPLMHMSPAWMRISPAGRSGIWLCVSDIQTMRMGGEAGTGGRRGGRCA